MFSLFKKSDDLKFSDKVWKSHDAMLQGMITDALTAIQSSGTAVIVSWFEDKSQSLRDYLDKKNIPHQDLYDRLSGNHTIQLTASDSFKSISLINSFAEKSTKGKIAFFFDGHYPLIAKESELLDKLKTLKRDHISVVFCQSLDGALMKNFGGEKLIGLMEQLGMKDDECLEHAMVSASIVNARKKLTEQVTNEMAARREEEWFSKNVRNNR